MAWNRQRIRQVSQDDFFALNSGKYTYEEFAEKVYVMIHTYYISTSGKIKSEFGKMWESNFGQYMSDETFEYMLVNEPIMLRETIIDQTKRKQEITSSKYLEKSLIAFEFDLWMIENHKKGNALKLTNFEKYIGKKYGRFLDDKYHSFKKFDLRHITDFEKIEKGIEPFYQQISEIFGLIISNNHMRINFENESADRTEEASDITPAEDGADVMKRRNAADASMKKEEKPLGRVGEKTNTVHLKEDIRREFEKDYKFMLKDKEDRIENLEKDIREFKRQRDEAREYSANQYDRGIKDLFASLNDPRYGRVIDYLYQLLHSGKIDECLASYLDNFFMALEDMEIEPIMAFDDVSVNEDTMLRQFNLDFNREDYDARKVKLKYAGWTYKETIMEKPTITMKED